MIRTHYWHRLCETSERVIASLKTRAQVNKKAFEGLFGDLVGSRMFRPHTFGDGARRSQRDKKE